MIAFSRQWLSREAATETMPSTELSIFTEEVH